VEAVLKVEAVRQVEAVLKVEAVRQVEVVAVQIVAAEHGEGSIGPTRN
jgi:hypothetical protein